MQQALYNTIATTAGNIAAINMPAPKTSRPGANLARWIVRKSDLVGVLALLGSSAAYGLYALAHTGL